MKKITLLVMPMLFASMVAMTVFASEEKSKGRCEFDAVGCDAYNVFNDWRKSTVVTNAKDEFGNLINHHSYWSVDGDKDYGEYFYTMAGLMFPCPCFSDLGYSSAMIDAWHAGVIFEWRIVLQMMPASDIELEIVTCTLGHNDFDLWGHATQDGWYRAPWGSLTFHPEQTEQITVEALPGPYASDAFKEARSFIMDARSLPGLGVVPLNNSFTTIIGFWGTQLLIAKPQDGLVNSSGQPMHALSRGDQIKITLTTTRNQVDQFYGPDNAVLKYIGALGTEYISGEACAEIQPLITVTSPNGGEELIAGTETKIIWRSAGIIPTVTIDYSINNGADWRTIGRGVKNIGYFHWKIPDTPSSECLLRISRPWYNDYTDMSDSVFSIKYSTSAESVLQFFDNSVQNGTLFAEGPGNSEAKRLHAFRKDLTDVVGFVNGGDIEEACQILMACYKKCDGSDRPPDFVGGPATSDLADMITSVIQSLRCD